MALKVGAEDKKKVAIAAVLGVIVIALLVHALMQVFGNPAPPASEPAPPGAAFHAPAAAPANGMHPAQRIVGSLANLDPTLHPQLMDEAESLEYTGEGRNIFSLSSAPVIEKVKGPIRNSAAARAALLAQGPPPPPPIDLKFFGYEAQNGGRKAFLLHGEDVFIAAEGDVVDRRYKVVRIQPFSIQITDMLYNNTQTLPLVQT